MGHHKHSDKTKCDYRIRNCYGYVDKIIGRGTKGNGTIAFCGSKKTYPIGRRVHR